MRASLERDLLIGGGKREELPLLEPKQKKEWGVVLTYCVIYNKECI